MKRHLLLFMAVAMLLMPATLKAQDIYNVDIGDFNENSNSNLLPFSTGNNYSLTQQIYTANEIDMPEGGTITQIYMADIISNNFSMSGVKVYMKNVSKDNFESNTDMVPLTENDKVWEGTFTQSGTIDLTKPFFYDGTSNLLICFYDPTSGYPGSYHKFTSTSTTSSHPGKHLALAYYGNAVPSLSNLNSYSGTKVLLNYRTDIIMLIAESIRHVMVYGFSEPTWGGHPDYTWSTPSDVHYHINTSACYWQDTTLNITLSEQDVFDQENHEYMLTYHFTCDSGYHFSDYVDVHLVGFSYDYIQEVGMDELGLYARTASFTVDTGETICNGHYTQSTFPVCGHLAYAYEKGEFVYPDNMLIPLINNKEITEMTFYATSGYQNVSWSGANFIVFLKEVESATIDDFYGYEDATVVYEGPLSVINGKITIPFSVPYTYHGAHLLVGVYNTTLGESNECMWRGIHSNGSAVWGADFHSIEFITPYGFNFLPKVSFGVTPVSDPATLVQVGHGSYTSSTAPTNVANKYSLTEQIYTAGEIGRAGNIYSIAFHNNGDTTTRNLDIYMVHTSQTTFDGNWVPVTSTNRVFSGNVNFRSDDWTTIELSAPFAYNGTSNLLLVVDDNTGTSTDSRQFRAFSGAGQIIGCFSDNTNLNPYNPSGYNTTDAGYAKNLILLGFTPIVCHAPTDIAVSDISKNSATVSWTETGTATEWQICVNGDEAHPITTTSNPYTLTGLTPNTYHSVKVQANCGGSNGVSEWSEKLHFTTPIFNPEDYAIQIGNGGNTFNQLPTNTWHRYSMSQQIYTAAEIGQAGDIHSISFYHTDYTMTRNLNIYMMHTNKTTFNNSTDWVPVTTADLVFSGNVKILSYEWTTIELDSMFLYNGNDNLLIVVDDNTNDWVSPDRNFKVFDAPNQAMYIYNEVTDYDPANPGGYEGSVSNVKNQIQLGILPGTCHTPNQLAVYDITINSATLSWVEYGNATEWQICLDGDESNLITVTTNPYTITGLPINTPHTVKVRANCGSDGPSFWTQEKSFRTILPSVQIGDGNDKTSAVPTVVEYNYTMSRQRYSAEEIGQKGVIYDISLFNTSGTVTRNLDIYMVNTSPSSHTSFVNVTTADLVFSGDVTFNSNMWSRIDLTTPFYYNGTDDLLLLVDDNTGTANNQTEFLSFSAYHEAIVISSDITNFDPLTYEAGYAYLLVKNQIQLGFLYRPCKVPTDLSVSNIDMTSVTLSWTENGTATEWEV